MDHNPQARRPHYHRGRRGPDRRGSDRRAPQQAQDQAPRASGDQVDVEQIMRDIRARIAQRHGIELSTQQIQELAARRLEAILDPRNVNPSLMEQLRRGAAAAPATAPAADPGFSFEDTTLYESHRGILRFIRRLLNPILKLFFNPNPLIHALHTQARLNREALTRESERERLQAEWNALHYEVVQRLVAEVARVSIEMQALALRVEALAGRVDFNDKRVRAMEAAAPPARTQPRTIEPVAAPAVPAPETAAAEGGVSATAPSEGTRRRRRRRRGRRGGAGPADATGETTAAAAEDLTGAEGGDLDEGDDDGPDEAPEAPEPAPVHVSEPAPPVVDSDVTAPPEQPTPPRDEPAASVPVDDGSAGPPER